MKNLCILNPYLAFSNLPRFSDVVAASVNPKVSRTIFYCVLISERIPQYILHDSVLFCKLYVLRSRKDVTSHRTKVKTLGGFRISVEKTLPSGVRF